MSASEGVAGSAVAFVAISMRGSRRREAPCVTEPANGVSTKF